MRDQCTFKDGTKGLCKFLTECQPALDLLKQGVFPENICGFKGTQSIVCCKDTSTKSPTQPTQATTTRPTPTRTEAPKPITVTTVTITNRTPGEISKQSESKIKCFTLNILFRSLDTDLDQNKS
ncbi:hypothetical protein NQ314_004197 [Rhamnusium bicolor]|uniref:Clip domain-containing protein n=1 Tax=Rhamnusium bicolor TaxID=1586634 RepID=A0AAV8ZKH8_9CUCU|nr:hypothetical protein NQ314_004197 [Rhamnusium bicolor]